MGILGALLGGGLAKVLGGSVAAGALAGSAGGWFSGLLAGDATAKFPKAAAQAEPELEDERKRKRIPDGRRSTMSNGNFGFDMQSILKQYLGQ